MPPNPRRLLELKAWQLKYATFLMGLPSTGTKAELDLVLRNRLCKQQPVFRGGRVVSVDMGIRNLAVCVVDVPPLDIGQRRGNGSSGTPFTVSHWQKRDLLLPKAPPTEEQSVPQAVVDGEGGKRRGGAKSKPGVAPSASNIAFTPSVLSKTAHDITMDLLSYKPSAILIERQRFRSGGGAAIQEWTVRVNMLESMLWACLQTMRECNSTGLINFPTVLEVSPARVANFWTAAPDMSLRPLEDMLSLVSTSHGPSATKLGRKKVQKKDKIAIVRSWLDGGDSDILLDFQGTAANAANAFRAQNGMSARKAGIKAPASDGKLDDLADCLLQAMAWVRWEENTHSIRNLL